MKNIIITRIIAILFLVYLCLPLSAGEKTLNVGVFNGFGASGGCIIDAVEAVKIDPAMKVIQVSANDILRGKLDELDVLVFPGGSGSRQTGNLGHLAIEKVRDFVRKEGKGIVGICAGAYLLSDTPDYACLNLFPVEAIDRDNDARGNGIIKCGINEKGLEIFPELKNYDSHYLHYYEGPLCIRVKKAPSSFTLLGKMISDVHHKEGVPAGMTPGKPSFMIADVGKGKVFLSVAHPETTPGMRWMVPRMVRWVADMEPVAYSSLVVRPGLYTKEILFGKELRDKQSRLFQTLLYGNQKEKIAALQTLVDIHSWSARQWFPGLLRDKDPKVRIAAAKALTDIEYTAIIDDLQTITDLEKDPDTKKQLNAYLKQLKNMVHR
jgi:hypothetical protein